MLVGIEQQIKLRDRIEVVNPAIRQFTRGSNSVIIMRIESILNMTSHQKSAGLTNLTDLFDIICEEEARTKHMPLYQERRFAKLGYLQGSTLRLARWPGASKLFDRASEI